MAIEINKKQSNNFNTHFVELSDCAAIAGENCKGGTFTRILQLGTEEFEGT